MPRVAVTGYASLDYPVALKGGIAGDRTSRILYRDPSAWPRPGGCPTYVAFAVAGLGQSVAPVTWIGEDAAGDAYLASLAARGIDAGAVMRVAGGRSPVAILAYQSDGACACLFDPALAGRETLGDAQRTALTGASHVCVTVGPPQLIGEILACCSAEARLYWVLKNDSECFTPRSCAALSARADVIFASRAERDMIASARPEATVVETERAGVRVSRGGTCGRIDVEALPVRDATGAGDSLAGGFVAAEMAGESDPLEAARIGADCARRLLEERLERES